MLSDPFPNHILVISPVNQPVHFPVISVAKKDAALNSFAKEYVRGFRNEEIPRTITALAVQELPVGRNRQRIPRSQFVGSDILSEPGGVHLPRRRVLVVA